MGKVKRLKSEKNKRRKMNGRIFDIEGIKRFIEKGKQMRGVLV